MATSKDDITYGTAQARHSEDATTRESYIVGQPIEGGKILHFIYLFNLPLLGATLKDTQS
ncbi:hypothetical protein MKX03_031332 [Papaver bracteatum]|nr:hypothetical protein MKX03_031332 [Papaver bracteatum]